ncbi:MAG TPA: sulfatase/phosphatase domain-containing protein, partial [Chloroflexota bacterium]|nr:sulfatase/phosphatase domain-containing protein [Chloroflexota bacterium]
YFYEDVLRVPLILRVPASLGAIPHPDDTPSALASHVDVVPTLLDLTGVDPLPDSPPLQGHSLLAGPRDAAFAEATPGDKPNPQTHARVVVTDRWKYVFRPEDDVRDELYDLESDPDELRNLAVDAAHQSTLQALQQRVAFWMRDTADPLTPPSGSLPHP